MTYRGEDGADAGGLFRDSTTQMVLDLFAADAATPAAIDLFIPCPNAVAGSGQLQDTFVPNPA